MSSHGRSCHMSLGGHVICHWGHTIIICHNSSMLYITLRPSHWGHVIYHIEAMLALILRPCYLSYWGHVISHIEAMLYLILRSCYLSYWGHVISHIEAMLSIIIEAMLSLILRPCYLSYWGHVIYHLGQCGYIYIYILVSGKWFLSMTMCSGFCTKRKK